MAKIINQKNIVSNLGFVLLYVPVAILGTSIAIPPGNVTPVYPAAGLAFGAYLLLGKKILPGIFLGGFIGNLVSILIHGYNVAAISATFFIGLGEVLASVIAATILLRYTNVSTLLENPRNVLLLFTVSLFWLVSPTIGVTSLAIHGFVEWDAYGYTWLTWWLGDVIGVMLITPLILLVGIIVKQGVRSFNFKHLIFAGILYGLLVAGLNISTWQIIFLLIPATMIMVLKYECLGASLASILSAVLVVGILLAGGSLYSGYELNHRLLLVQLLIGVNVFSAYFLAAHVQTITRLNQSVSLAQRESEIDPLTGLLNRRGFERQAEKILHQTRQDDCGLTLLMIDLDNFKAVNDNFGHDRGDCVLVTFTNALQQLLRTNDLAARIGGEEFVLLFETANTNELNTICQRLLTMTEELRYEGLAEDFHLTLSGGIAVYEKPMSISDLLSDADKRLYVAKKSGKNQITWP